MNFAGGSLSLVPLRLQIISQSENIIGIQFQVGPRTTLQVQWFDGSLLSEAYQMHGHDCKQGCPHPHVHLKRVWATLTYVFVIIAAVGSHIVHKPFIRVRKHWKNIRCRQFRKKYDIAENKGTEITRVSFLNCLEFFLSFFYEFRISRRRAAIWVPYLQLKETEMCVAEIEEKEKRKNLLWVKMLDVKESVHEIEKNKHTNSMQIFNQKEISFSIIRNNLSENLGGIRRCW